MLNKYKKKIVITFLIILWFFWIALKGYISGSNVVPIWYDPWLYRWIHLAYSWISNDFNLLNLPNRVKHEPLWWIASVNNTIIWWNIELYKK
jgi:hypothetical protein